MGMQETKQPLTPDEYAKLLTVLSFVATSLASSIDRLLTQGVMEMDESLDDGRVAASQKKIESCRNAVRKEQERLKKLRDHLRHKREFNRN
jgi:hypothetical protein